LRTTTFEYDDNSRRNKTIYPDGSFDLVGYDVLGRSVSKTDQAGKTTQFIYDVLGRLTKVKDALNQETTYSYNELGQQLTQTDANNHTTRYEYDQLGRRVKRTLLPVSLRLTPTTLAAISRVAPTSTARPRPSPTT